MKKIIISIILIISVINISSMQTPEKGTRRKLFDEQTSPTKPIIASPDPMSKRVRKEHTGYSETERESEYERKYKNIQTPIFSTIRNNFNYPILVVYPHNILGSQSFEAIKPEKLSKAKNIRSDGIIIISANNKIHKIEYILEPDKQYFLDTIDDVLEKEWETAKEVEIEIGKDGNLRLKPVKQ